MFKNKSRVRVIMWLTVFAAFVVAAFVKPKMISDIFRYLKSVFGCVVGGFCMAFILNLIMNPIEALIRRVFRKFLKKTGRIGWIRALSIVLTFIVSLAVLTLLVAGVFPALRDVADTVYVNLPGAIESMPTHVEETLIRWGVSGEWLESIKEALYNVVQEAKAYVSNITDIAGFAFTVTTGVLGGIVDVILVIAVSVYALATKEDITAAAHHLADAYLSNKKRGIVHDVSELMYEKFSEFFRGQIIEALILGVMCYVGMLIFRFPASGSVSVVVGISAIIPVIGPWVGSIAGILLTLIASPDKALWFTAYILILQQIEDNLIYPRVVGKSLGIPGLLVLCAVIIGMEIYGMIGIIVAVPIAAVLYDIIKKQSALRIEARAIEARNEDTH